MLLLSCVELTDQTIGVVIGSSIAAISGIIAAIIQGVITSRIESKRKEIELAKLESEHAFSMSELQEKERLSGCRELFQKREKAYLDFINLYGRIVTAVAFKVSTGGIKADVDSAQNESSVVAQAQYELGTFLRQHSDAITAIKLYGSIKVINLMKNLMMDFYNVSSEPEITKERILGLDAHLSNVAQEMNFEMAQFSNSNKSEDNGRLEGQAPMVE